MELIRGLHNLRPPHRGGVASIGNYDGVHLGHQSVIEQLAEQRVEHNLPSAIITFEPQPQEYFAPNDAPSRLMSLRDKVETLSFYGVDRVLCLRFDRKLAELAPESFIQKILVDGLVIKSLVVGDDFRFGKDRRGDFSMLQQAGRRHGFDVIHTRTFDLDGMRVSSTRVRGALETGELDLVERLLGRRFHISGRVVRGDRRGRQWGFPTANVYLQRLHPPLIGVFAVEVYGLAPRSQPGAAYVGSRPTIAGTHPLLEVHLFDFHRDIYGKHIRVEFVSKIRGDQNFASVDALREQITRDVAVAKTLVAGERVN